MLRKWYVDANNYNVLNYFNFFSFLKATPADWQVGEDCMVLPTIKEDQVANLFPLGVKSVKVPSGKNYIRKTPCPNGK